MPLVEHLRELRNRLAKGMLAIVVVTIAAAFYSQALMEFLSAPVPRCEKGLGETTGARARSSRTPTFSPPSRRR